MRMTKQGMRVGLRSRELQSIGFLSFGLPSFGLGSFRLRSFRLRSCMPMTVVWGVVALAATAFARSEPPTDLSSGSIADAPLHALANDPSHSLAATASGVLLDLASDALAETHLHPAEDNISPSLDPSKVVRTKTSALPDAEERLREQIRTARLGPSVVRAGGPPLSVPSLTAPTRPRTSGAEPGGKEHRGFTTLAAFVVLGGAGVWMLCLRKLGGIVSRHRSTRSTSSTPASDPSLERAPVANCGLVPDFTRATRMHQGRAPSTEPLPDTRLSNEDSPNREHRNGTSLSDGTSNAVTTTNGETSNRETSIEETPNRETSIEDTAKRRTPSKEPVTPADRRDLAPIAERAAHADARLDQIEQSLLAVTNLLRGVALEKQSPSQRPTRRRRRRPISGDVTAPGLPSAQMLEDLRRDHDAGLVSAEELEERLGEAWNHFLGGIGDDRDSGATPPKSEDVASARTGAAARIARSPRVSRRPAETQDLGDVRERVLELAGKGLSTAEICEAVAVGPHEVNLILKTLFRRS